MLANKRAVITGATDGIGWGIAEAFAKQGANVLLVARDETKLRERASQLQRHDVEIHTISADLGDSATAARVSCDILNIWPELNVLVNNAGVARFLPFPDTTEADLDTHLNVNVKTPYLLTQSLYPALRITKGSVINVSSYFSRRMLPGRPSTAYSLTKGAIDSFTKALACEAGPLGVRVNAIAPGTVNTPLVRTNLGRLSPEEQTKFGEMISTIYPLGRIGEPDDVAGAAVFLASDQSRWITGAILPVDGGLTTN